MHYKRTGKAMLFETQKLVGEKEFRAESRKRPRVGKSLTRVKVNSYLEAGAGIADALARMSEHGGLICSLGLCDREGEIDLRKGMRFLVVSAVFFLGLIAVKRAW